MGVYSILKNLKMWVLKIFHKSDISELPVIPIGNNGAYRCNWKYKPFLDGLYKSLLEIDEFCKRDENFKK